MDYHSNGPTPKFPNLSLYDLLAPQVKKPPTLLGSLFAKPKAFVSYHHGNDQWYYDRFSRLFSDSYEILTDVSVDRLIDSDDCDYQSRCIREDYITGSSITIVLCGAETWKRKHVDWELHATLEKKHALLGIRLPTNGEGIVPERFLDNFRSGYARWIDWSESAQAIEAAIAGAKQAAEQTQLIRNSRYQMARNVP